MLTMLVLLLIPGMTWAQQGTIELKSNAEVEVTETNSKGEKIVKRLEIGKSKIVPGEILVYTTTYRNNGTKPAEKIVITNPVPQHMNYVEKSAEGAGTKIDFSADHGKTYGAPETLFVTDSQGNKQKATAADYTDIRWTLLKPLPSGSSGSVSFKAKLQ
jgi:uncharacterized repeat protein (TIGR01451 family)